MLKAEVMGCLERRGRLVVLLLWAACRAAGVACLGTGGAFARSWPTFQDWLGGGVPYVDFPLPFAPGAALTWWAALGVAEGPLWTARVFGLFMLIADLAVLVLVGRIIGRLGGEGASAGRARVGQSLYLLATATLGLTLFHTPAVLTILFPLLSIYWAVARRARLSLLSMGVGLFTGAPAWLALPLVVYGLHRGREHHAGGGGRGEVPSLPVLLVMPLTALLPLIGGITALWGAGSLKGLFAPFLAGLTPESLGGGILTLVAIGSRRFYPLDFVGDRPCLTMAETGTVVGITLVLLAAWVVITVVAWHRSARRDPPGEALLGHVTVALLPLVALGPGMGPPWLVALIPLLLVSLIGIRRPGEGLRAGLAGAVLLSLVMAVFYQGTRDYADLLHVALAVLRGGLVVLLTVGWLRHLRRGTPRPAGIESPDPSLRGRWLPVFALAVLFAWAFLCNLGRISTNDFWLHLRIGADFLATGELPTVDPYSAVAAGRPYFAHEWLSGVVFHLADSALGGRGLSILRACLGLVPLLLLYLAVPRMARRHHPLLFLLLALSSYLISYRLFLRPHLFTFLFLALTVLVVESWRRRRRFRLLLLLVPAQVLWINLHGGGLLGPCLLLMLAGAHGAAACAGRVWGRAEEPSPWVGAIQLGVTGALCGLACLVNPYGAHLVDFIFTLSEGSAFIKESIYEWKSGWAVGAILGQEHWWTLFWVAVALLWFGQVIRIKEWTRAAWMMDLAVVLFLTVYGAKAVRFVPFTGILGFPLMVRAGLRLFDPPGRGRGGALLGWATLAAGLLLLVNVSLYGYTFTSRARREIALGYRRDTPFYAMNAIKEAGLQGPVFNNYGDGAFIIYHLHPRVRPVMDARVDLYGAKLFEEYERTTFDPKAFDRYLDKYGIKIAMLKHDRVSETWRNHLLGSYAWRVLHRDPYRIVFVRD